MATAMPPMVSCRLALTRLRERCARRVLALASRRNNSARPTTIGTTSSVSRASSTLRTNSSTVTNATISTWLIRSMVRVETVAKSSVSEVTRLTIRPDGVSS